MNTNRIKTAAASLALASALMAAADAGAQERVRWKMASAFPGAMAQLGTLGKEIERKIDLVSDGEMEIRFFEPGALVPALEMFDAVSKGAVDAAWSTPGYWAGKIPASPLFAAVPFGPAAGEYLAWIYYGGGKELWEEIAHRHNIHPVFCGIIAPEASGWFREEIRTVEDLRGLKMRFFGLGARVMQKVGVSAQLIAGGDIYPALERGVIDATEYSMPAIDYDLGFFRIAKHYYFPGWHQQSTLFDLMIHKGHWDGLSDQQRAQIEMVCGDNIRQGMAEGEAIQTAALKRLEGEGVTIHSWPPEILDALEAAWQEVVSEASAEDEDFRRVWESLASFRENYRTWKELGYLE